MKWTTLYKRAPENKHVYYYNMDVRRDRTGTYLTVFMFGDLTAHVPVQDWSIPYITEEEAVAKLSRQATKMRNAGWKTAQELGINSNKQAWTPFTSGTLEQLLQLLLP